MGREAVYMTALEVRPERLEDLRHILRLRDKAIHQERTRDGFAELLKRELPHLAEAFTPEGVGAFLNAYEPYLSEDGFLDLGSVYNGGTEEEAILLSHFLMPGELLVVSDEEEPLYGYKILGEGEVERLRAALVDSRGQPVWME